MVYVGFNIESIYFFVIYFLILYLDGNYIIFVWLKLGEDVLYNFMIGDVIECIMIY